MKSRYSIVLSIVIAVMAVTMLSGCGGRVLAPREGSLVWYYHPELPEAANAVEDARKAGKDTMCPNEFQAAKHRMEEAYRAYWACKTEEGIRMAKEATAMAKALCPQPAACTLTASPQQIQAGQSSVLTFKTSGTVQSAKLDGEEVPVTGTTKTVSPMVTTTYTGQVTGVGGTQTATATVTVVPAPAQPERPVAQPAQPVVIDKMAVKINFDFDQYNIRQADEAELKKAIEFVRKYPNNRVKIEGHTDSIGDEKYNQKLSERRAQAVRDYLVKKGAVNEKNISTVGYGELKPVASNESAKGRAENRRAEILIYSE